MLKNKSSNMSETCKDRRKVNMNGLWELANSLSNGTILDPLKPALPKIGGSQPPLKTAIENRGKTIAHR